jgi:hypothetical protein
MERYIYTWIAFHGITDILLPLKIWLPFYIISPITLYIPFDILNFITILLSVLHFSYDLYFINYFDILLVLLVLLYFGEYKFSQYTIISYMSLIHVPLQLYKINYDYFNIILLLLTYFIIYNFDLLMNNIIIILESGGRLPNNNYHKLLLGIINAHILTNLYILY